MDKVAVVILNWNGEEMLRRFLPGVLAHTQAEIYVADNASTDKSLELLSVDFPAVKQSYWNRIMVLPKGITGLWHRLRPNILFC